ncbi:MAG: hypothetical protein AAFX76_05405, partial [Planctomycetota bacterium]
MGRSVMLVGGGVVAAIIVVALAAWLGGPAQSASTGPAPTPPVISSPGVTFDDLAQPDRGRVQPVEVVRDFDITELYREDSDGSVTRFSAAEVTPLADFVAEAKRPAAEMRFPSGRVLLITADEGKFFHPGNEPNRGEFRRNTVVTQYQPPPGEAADLASDRHVQFRLYLDDVTTFDRERGHVRSAGPVRLVGPDLDFTGVGLDLTFNVLADRIERLVVDRGDLLRFDLFHVGLDPLELFFELFFAHEGRGTELLQLLLGLGEGVFGVAHDAEAKSTPNPSSKVAQS